MRFIVSQWQAASGKWTHWIELNAFLQLADWFLQLTEIIADFVYISFRFSLNDIPFGIPFLLYFYVYFHCRYNYTVRSCLLVWTTRADRFHLSCSSLFFGKEKHRKVYLITSTHKWERYEMKISYVYNTLNYKVKMFVWLNNYWLLLIPYCIILLYNITSFCVHINQSFQRIYPRV